MSEDEEMGTVVVYTSVDQHYSEPVLKAFEDKTGIRTLVVYDVEASKTTGLVNRIIAEKSHPQADVFWNGEFAQTLSLKQEDILAPYDPVNANDIPAHYRDPEGYWVGFAGRARVLLVNTDLLSPSNYPNSIFDLIDPVRPSERIGLAYPLFGTTATHAAAIYAALGSEKGKAFFEKLRESGVIVVDGNSVVRDLVADGRLTLGITDTDDACGAIKKGAPVAIIFPDQDSLGTLIIPNTVALIADAPHPEEARKLIDFLLSRETEGQLVASGWSHIPVRPVGIQPNCLKNNHVKGMNVSYSEVFQKLNLSKGELREIFIR